MADPKSKYDVNLFPRPASNTKFVKCEERKTVREAETQRYRPGRTPRWHTTVGDDSESDDGALPLPGRVPPPPQPSPLSAPPPVQVAADPRLARLAAARENLQGPRRRVRQAEVLEVGGWAPCGAAEEGAAPPQAAPAPAGGEGEESADDFERRRQRARAVRAAAAEEAKHAPPPPPTAEDEDESEYEEVTDSEESDEPQPQQQQLAKAVFVRREERVTALEKRRHEEQRRAEAERLVAVRERRRGEAHRLAVTAAAKRDGADGCEGESDTDLPDDTDYPDDPVEYQAWRLRELERTKRYKEERRREEAEKLEVERRRLLSDDARKKEDIEYQRRLEAMGLNREKVKWNYMQKYYHKGAYFMDTAEKGLEQVELHRRDIGHAVGADKFDKSQLPKAMQVRGGDFGKKGQTKWTHLTAEDTSIPKDREGNMTENPFTSITFASSKSTVGANQAHQTSENMMMFRNAVPGQLGQKTLGSATYGSAGRPGRDDAVERPAKRKRT
eukprot:TRINITY_DN65306_c0_g1_i1.p2 TRINITY_DN65306_c0_g1~~TRINITY_DN65306_c0_g1_i1.p2  ORF type:complete len:531 (+),score=211.31 TRINITY_DN65306_c0_g1_i1:92-1594(+)